METTLHARRILLKKDNQFVGLVLFFSFFLFLCSSFLVHCASFLDEFHAVFISLNLIPICSLSAHSLAPDDHPMRQRKKKIAVHQIQSEKEIAEHQSQNALPLTGAGHRERDRESSRNQKST
jgi:hypothetical protein